MIGEETRKILKKALCMHYVERQSVVSIVTKKNIIMLFGAFMLIAVTLSVLPPACVEPITAQSTYAEPSDGTGSYNHYGYGHGYRHGNGTNCGDGLGNHNNHQHRHGYMNGTLPDAPHTPGECPYNTTIP